MYQSIDDPQNEGIAIQPKRNWLIWLAVFICLFAIFAIVYITSPGVSAPQKVDDFTKAELVTYRKAISESEAPMRRARLHDFLTTYPNSTRIPSVQAQLDVIQSYEATQWIDLTNIVYNPELQNTEKLAALNNYATTWDGALLGGRSEDIKSIREKLEANLDHPSLPCLLYTSPSPRDGLLSRMPSSA